jgi:hypothetical protein
MAQWRALPANLDKRAMNNFEGGLNVGRPSFELKGDMSTDEVGFSTDEFPALLTRKGRTTYGTSGAAVTRLLTNYAQTHLFRAVGGKLQYHNGTDWTDIATLTDADWDATNFNNKLLITNGTDNVKQWNGTTLSDLSASAPKGKYITNDTVRVWIAKDDVLYFSGFLAESDWTSAENSGSVQYYTPNGGSITGLKNFANHICIWKKDSFAEIFGTNYYNFRLIENSNDIGCVSFKTIQEVGDTLFWLGQNDVYAYKGGRPIPVGQRVRKYLNDINQTYIDKCFGGTDGLRYYLGLVTGANTEPDTLLIYDPRYDIWRVRSLNENFRYSAQFNNLWYIGDSAGQTWKMNDGTTDNGTAISWSVTSKPFDEGLPDTEKEYYEMHIQAYLPTGSTLTVSVSTDDRGTTFTPVYTATTDDMAQNMNIIIPLDTVPITEWFRYKLSGTGPVTIYKVTRYFRVQPTQH